MKEKDLLCEVRSMVDDLKRKIERSVPEEGDFRMVYSEFKNSHRDMCLTDIMLQFHPIPAHLTDYKTERWLELVGYKLPCPYKSTVIIFKGTKQETLGFLTQPEVIDKILDLIPRLNYNLSDV